MTKLIMPKLWHIARIKYIDARLEDLPDVRFVMHRGRQTIRLDGHEYRDGTRSWNNLYSIAVERRRLLDERHMLILELKNHYGISYSTIKDNYIINCSGLTACNSSFFDSLRAEANGMEKTTEYNTDGINFRSRLEMEASTALRSLGVQYKYETGLFLNDQMVCPDFSLNFPEFNCCVFWEVLGRMSEHSYAYSQGKKVGDYAMAGLVVGRDLFLTGATKNYMPNEDMLKEDIIHIVNLLCRLCIHEVHV